MTELHTISPSISKPHISTEVFAKAIFCSPATIRKRYSITGSYYGIQPKKLPSRRLLWPSNAVELLLRTGNPSSHA